MALKPWKKVSEKTRHVNPFWTYKEDEILLPDGNNSKYYYVHTAGSVFIIPVTDSGDLLLVRQYRYLNQVNSLEFPGGGVKSGENPDSIAEKELIEETGYSGILEKIGHFNPFNGVTDEICHVYLATNLSASDAYQKDVTEEFELVNISPKQLEICISNNEINDGMTLAAWALAKSRIQ